MPRFRVIVAGTGMDIPPEGCAGFATTRFVRATSAEGAARQALSLVAESVRLEPAFNSSPFPSLSVHAVIPVRSPFKRARPNSGYTFVGSDTELTDALDIESKAGAGWLL